jgi:hypothetical protein
MRDVFQFASEPLCHRDRKSLFVSPQDLVWQNASHGFLEDIFAAGREASWRTAFEPWIPLIYDQVEARGLRETAILARSILVKTSPGKYILMSTY